MTTIATSPIQPVDTWQVHGAERWTRLLVQTAHSRYELQAIAHACVMVLVRGGRYFAEPRLVLVAGARYPGPEIRLGTIHVGLPLELLVDDAVIRTSPVRRIVVATT